MSRVSVISLFLTREEKLPNDSTNVSGIVHDKTSNHKTKYEQEA